MKKTELRIVIANVILPLAVGIVIYTMKDKFQSTGFVHNQLCDGLWAFAFGSNCWLVEKYFKNPSPSFSLNYCLPIALGYELFQCWNIVPGTFDSLDLLVISFSILLSQFILSKTTKTQIS